MRKASYIFLVAISAVILAFYTLGVNIASGATSPIYEKLTSIEPFAGIITASPAMTLPNWYIASSASSSSTIFTYTISTNGSTKNDIDEFASQVSQTFADSRGWSRLGVTFVRVDSGGQFNIILAQASTLPSYSSGCSVDWSCRVGSSVIINDDRWSNATDAWNTAGGSLRDYRHMVINHEVGHWLGHDHENCSGDGELAPIMQQQSIDLQGCKFNAWPLDSEIWSSRL